MNTGPDDFILVHNMARSRDVTMLFNEILPRSAFTIKNWSRWLFLLF